MNCFCIFQHDYAQSACIRLINSLPSPDPAIMLKLLRIRISHHSFNPFHPDLLSVWAHPHVQKILRAFHLYIVL